MIALTRCLETPFLSLNFLIDKYLCNSFSALFLSFEAGGAGTIFLKDTQRNTTTLIVNNNNVGAPKTDDITNEVHDGGRTWITLESSIKAIDFDLLDIRGKAQLAVLTDPPSSAIHWGIRTFTGDLSGILHIQANQSLKMTSGGVLSNIQKLPLGVNVYSRGDVQLPENMYIDGIKVIVAGSVSGAQNVIVGNEGKLVLRYLFLFFRRRCYKCTFVNSCAGFHPLRNLFEFSLIR